MKKNHYFLYALAILLCVTVACWASAFDNSSGGNGRGSSWSSRSGTSQGGYGGGFSGGHK